MIVFDYSDIRARMERRGPRPARAVEDCWSNGVPVGGCFSAVKGETVNIYVKSGVSAREFIFSREQLNRMS